MGGSAGSFTPSKEVEHMLIDLLAKNSPHVNDKSKHEWRPIDGVCIGTGKHSVEFTNGSKVLDVEYEIKEDDGGKEIIKLLDGYNHTV